MKFLSLIALLLLFLLPFSPVSANAAIAKSSQPGFQEQVAPSGGKFSKKEKKRNGLLHRLKVKLKQKFEKLKMKLLNGTARDYLFISLGLLVAAILFFALNSSAGIFNIFGSIAFIGAAIFFVIWLLKSRNG